MKPNITMYSYIPNYSFFLFQFLIKKKKHLGPLDYLLVFN